MTAYQLDECIDSKRLVDACTTQALVEVQRFPRSLKGSNDPRILGSVLPSGRTLLTIDRTIHTSHASGISETHPGILIVARASSVKTLTTRDAMDILSQFKTAFPIVELTEIGIEIWRVLRGVLERVVYLAFDAPGWQDALARALERNASAGLIDRNEN
jgi:hypothetical protein